MSRETTSALKNCINNKNLQMFEAILGKKSNDASCDELIKYIVRKIKLRKREDESKRLTTEDKITFLESILRTYNGDVSLDNVKELIISALIDAREFDIFKHCVKVKKFTVPDFAITKITKYNLTDWFLIAQD